MRLQDLRDWGSGCHVGDTRVCSTNSTSQELGLVQSLATPEVISSERREGEREQDLFYRSLPRQSGVTCEKEVNVTRTKLTIGFDAKLRDLHGSASLPGQLRDIHVVLANLG